MRRYETFIILDPDISEDQRSIVLQRTSDVIKQQDGFLAFIDEWGARQLAYEIRKKTRGYYVRFDFCGTGTVVTEMERNFRIDDRVLKFMTVLTDEKPDLASVKEEIALAESEKAKAKEEAAAREKAAALAQEEAESQPQDESQPETESPPEAQAQTDQEQPRSAQAQPEDEEPDTEKQGDKAPEAVALETETPSDEAVPTNSEEETK
jgi:small subunit ribosomal protein S6